MYTLEDIQAVDPEIAAAITAEFDRQNSHIELIASENWVSPAVMSAMGSVLTNKYAEGYPGKRYYGGCECVDVVEELARERAKKLFGCEYVNVQPHSGAQANMAVQFAILKPGDTIMGMNLDHGGHLTHGSPVNFSGTYFHVVPYGVNDEGFIDYDKVREIALECKPKMIIAGASAYARTIDFKKFREIADEVNAVLMVDMAHIAGLVAAGLHPSPIPYADVVTTFTLITKDMPAAYDAENKKLVEAEGFDTDALKAYLGNITSVNVNGKDYAASGRGSVVIINKDGTIKTDADPFKDAVAGTEFQITVASTGYTTPLTFTYKIAETPAPAEVDTTALEAAIAEADNLKEADYTADSWKALQSVLTEAQKALDAKESHAALAAQLDLSGKRVIDVGTGAGFPGMVLAILTPDARFTLLDSLGKRVDFLKEVQTDLALKNVTCVHARAEEFAAQHREQFDLAVSRAVAALPVLCELCLPLVKPGGKFLAMKSVESDPELQEARSAIAQLGGQLSGVTDYTVPETDVVHRIVSIEKTQRTPKQFPRAFARIKKAPLV